MAITSSQASVTSGTAVVCTLPSGTVVGDTVVAFAAGGFGVTGPGVVTGWTQVWYDGSTSITSTGLWWKVMTSGDISAGNMTINWTGSFDHQTILVKIPGAPTYIEEQHLNQTAGTSTNKTCTGAVTTGSTGLYFIGARGGGNAESLTVTPGVGSVTLLQTVSTTNCDSKGWSQTMPGGSQTNAFGFVAGNGMGLIQAFWGAGGVNVVLPIPDMDGMGKYGRLKGGLNG